MPDSSTPQHIEALLALGEQDTDPQVRLAALETATRLTLNPEAWQRIARASWRIVQSQPRGAALRAQALAFAAGVPTRSLREHLREVADDEHDPDREVVAQALDAVADPGRIPALIAGLARGECANYRHLAAMPLEQAGLSTDDLPPPRDPDEDEGVAAFWWALCRARLGDFAGLDALFSAPEGAMPWRLPALFWGSPWAAYAQIAAIRPIPRVMHHHLLRALKRWGPRDANSGSDDRARALALTVWAATGIADAEGQAFGPPPVAGPVSLPDPFNPPESAAALAAAALAAGPTEYRLHPADGDSARGASAARFDDAQIGWMIAREPETDFVPALLALDSPQHESETRVRLLQLIGLAADAQRGRAVSPWRGAAAGPGDLARERPPLIDDLPRAAARSAGLEPGIRPISVGDKGARSTGARPGKPARSAEDVRRFTAGAAPIDSDTGTRSRTTRTRSGPDRTPRLRSLSASVPDLILDADALAFALAGKTAGMRAAAGSAESAQSAETPEAAQTGNQTQPGKDARRVNAQLVHEDTPHRYFVAGAPTTVRCWIGLRQAGIPSANAPIQHVDELPPEGLELVVELCWSGMRAGQPAVHGNGPAGRIHLPADRSKPTEPCALTLDVPADIEGIEALLMFRYQGKVFEAVTLSAPVLPAGSADEGLDDPLIEVSFGQREVIQLDRRTPVDAALVFGPRHLRLFGGTGGQIFELGDTEKLMAFLNDALFFNDTELVRRRAQLGQKEGEALLDVTDERVTDFLRGLAMHGYALFQNLRRQGFTDPGERIQVINLDEERAVPLEFIYDLGLPRRGAPLCAGWQAALSGDGTRCAACDAAAEQAATTGSWRETICPLGFWAMRKVIERFDAQRLNDLSLPAAQRRSLRPLDSALCASTHFVPAPERDQLRAALSERIPAPVVVDDWDQWEHEVAQHNPPLLILLAHHDLEAGLDYLEIGDHALDEERRWRFRPQLNETLINPAPIEPGPIVLLLGCETSREVAETGYGSLATQFKDFHASLVLGTMAKILGRHAAPLAAELVTALATVDGPDADFGTLLRRIRRRLLAHGVLMAFALVAIGDAEWRLAVRPARPPLTPHPRLSPGGFPSCCASRCCPPHTATACGSNTAVAPPFIGS